MNLRSTLLAAAVALVVLAPATLAQTNPNAGSIFGSVVKVGDWDYVPVTKGTTATPTFMVADFGGLSEMTKICVLLLKDAAAPANGIPRSDDLRIAGCPDGAPGTKIGSDIVLEGRIAFAPVAATIQYGDNNGNGKFDAGDALFATTSAVAGLATPAIGASAATTSWTIRLVAFQNLPAGVHILPGDFDFIQFRSSAKILASTSMSVAEREDKAVFLATLPSGTAKGVPLPLNSVRLGPIGQTFNTPNIQATKIALASSATPEAGKSFNIVVSLLNGGSGGGAGLLVTKMDNTLIDARMSVPVSAGQTDMMSFPITIPCGGSHELKVNDGFLVIQVNGAECSANGGASAAQVQALQERVAALESGTGGNGKSTPTLLAIAVVALGAVAFLMRRRA